MNRDEFLRTLREALSGEIPPNIIEENIRYYDAYIADEVRKGRTEEEVIEELGGARVIAKTIIDLAAAGGDAGTGDPYGDAWQESAYGGGGSGRQSSSGGYGSGSAGGYGSGGAGGDGFDPFGFGSREEQRRRGGKADAPVKGMFHGSQLPFCCEAVGVAVPHYSRPGKGRM